MSHPKIFVRAGRNSHCTLIEHYLGPNDAETFTNAVVSLDLEAGARMSHYRLQLESTRSFHIATVHARLDRDSRYQLPGHCLWRRSGAHAHYGKPARARVQRRTCAVCSRPTARSIWTRTRWLTTSLRTR